MYNKQKKCNLKHAGNFIYIFSQYCIAAYTCSLFKCAQTISHLNPFHMWYLFTGEVLQFHIWKFHMWNHFPCESVPIPHTISHVKSFHILYEDFTCEIISHVKISHVKVFQFHIRFHMWNRMWNSMWNRMWNFRKGNLTTRFCWLRNLEEFVQNQVMRLLSTCTIKKTICASSMAIDLIT